jgi:hypothetical protein
MPVDPVPLPDQIRALYSQPLQRKFNFHPSTSALSGQAARQNHKQLRDARLLNAS